MGKFFFYWACANEFAPIDISFTELEILQELTTDRSQLKQFAMKEVTTTMDDLQMWWVF